MSFKLGKNAVVVRQILIVFVSLLCVQPATSRAQSSRDNGQIDVRSARLLEIASGWELSADVEIALSREIRQGLDSGVPLQFIVEFCVKRVRALLPDKSLFETEYRYNLIYYELTRHYRLQSVTTKESRNYRSLLAALDDLGQIRGLVVNRLDGFDEPDSLTGHVNVRLDYKALPLPLQPLLSSTWRLASEDFTWSLN